SIPSKTKRVSRALYPFGGLKQTATTHPMTPRYRVSRALYPFGGLKRIFRNFINMKCDSKQGALPLRGIETSGTSCTERLEYFCKQGALPLRGIETDSIRD